MDAELQWDAAILTVMVDGDPQGADGAGSRALQSMVSAWREAPVAGTLSQKVGSSAQGLLRSAWHPPLSPICIGDCCCISSLHKRSHSAVSIWLQPCMTSLLYEQVVSGIIQRARDAAGAALSEDRSADSPALDSRPGVLSGLSSMLRGQGAGVQPAQQHNKSDGHQSAVALPAAMQNLPTEALRYILSGVLGRSVTLHPAPCSVRRCQKKSSGLLEVVHGGFVSHVWAGHSISLAAETSACTSRYRPA